MKDQSNSSYYNYTEFKPQANLKAIIEKIWVFDSVIDLTDNPHFGLIPDYTPSIIFIIPQNNSNISLFITGPNTQNVQFNTYTEQITIGMRFYPGMLHSFFSLNVSQTLNNILNLENFFDKKDLITLRKDLVASSTTFSKSALLSSFISKYINNKLVISDEISRVIDKIITADGALKLEELYSGLSISQRQFQRNFTKRTGLTPKEFSRIVRFHKVTRKLVKNNFRHFDTLVESGYYDQSHYYREFKEFLGMLPGKFESRQKRIEYKELLK